MMSGMNYQISYPAGVEGDYDYWEIEQKGWMDIVVAFDGKELPLSIYDRNRLDLDMRNEFERLGYFAARNLVVVSKVNRAEIEIAVAKLAARNFSDLIEPFST